VFFATDTLIHSITVWGPAPVDNSPRHLFITETVEDSVYGFGPAPDVWRVLFGPSLMTPSWDGVHAPQYRCVFDPPFALPHRGKFFFDMMANEWIPFPVLAITTDPYPDGAAWETGPVWDCSRPGQPFSLDLPAWDLAFEVQLCGAGAVGVPPPGARGLSLSAIPNPFQREVRVDFDLPSSTYVRLAVFDITGRQVASLVDGVIEPGPHSATWRAPGAVAGRAGSGLYFVRMEALGQRLTRSIVHVE
jgi:hypothetical protein